MPFSPIAGDELGLAVCGAHMSGLPLNRKLTARRAPNRKDEHSARIQVI